MNNTSSPTGSALYIGLMSGTSIDGIDCALVDCSPNGTPELLTTLEFPIEKDTRERIAAISAAGADEIERMGVLDRELGEAFAQAALALLSDSGHSPGDIRAIGSHGQTIRHRPPSAADAGSPGFTLQIGDPNTIAEITGITTVADFRRRDIAAGGEGAPLAPAFHRAFFSHPDRNRAIVNIGGIANVSVLQHTALTAGFDTGPGNTLLDRWIQQQRREAYDRGGQWAADGSVNPGLLAAMLQHPFLQKTGPRSTGKEEFNPGWLAQCLTQQPESDPQNVQATLAQLTAETIAQGLVSTGVSFDDVYVCGGGAHNTDLMRRLHQLVQPAVLDNTGAAGMDPDWVEAVAFAWLARQSLEALPGNAPAVTGASGERVLGAIYAAN